MQPTSESDSSEAALFTPVPGATVCDGAPGRRTTPRRSPEADHAGRWATTWALLDEAVQAARDDPADAQRLYNLCTFGSRNPQAADRILDDFVNLEIPIDRLSHTPTAGPFA